MLNVYERYRRVSVLGKPTRERLLELVEALADDGEYEEPGDPGAPPFYYLVAARASETLGEHAREVLDELGHAMRAHALAAQQGVRLLPRCGAVGTPYLIEVLRGPHVWGRQVAVHQVTEQLRVTPAAEREPLVRAFLECLADPDAGVVFNALSEARHLFKNQPRLARLASQEVVDRLVERMRAQPAAGTYAEVCQFFAERPGVVEAWVDLAAGGAAAPAELLLGHVPRLTETDIHRLCTGRLHLPLLGALGERALEAAPRVRELLPDSAAAITLSRMGVELDLAAIFLQEADFRVQEALVRGCAHPERLAQEVLPKLHARWNNRLKDISVLRAVGAFKGHAVSELPWLLELLNPYGKWCSDAVGIISWFGEEARPAFPALAKLLDHTDQRGPVLKALQRLGPVAKDDFLLLLEVLELESKRWLVWQRNWWVNQLQETLKAVRG